LLLWLKHRGSVADIKYIHPLTSLPYQEIKKSRNGGSRSRDFNPFLLNNKKAETIGYNNRFISAVYLMIYFILAHT